MDPETGKFRLKTNARLNVRWMSPDALKTWVFSEETDLYAFGIVMWEVITYVHHSLGVDCG